MATYLSTFPRTAGAFGVKDVIPLCLNRQETATWLKEIEIMHPGIFSSEIDKWTTTLKNLCEKTKELYEIQSNFNIQDNKPANVMDQSFYFPPLFESHKLWADLSHEMKRIFHVIRKTNLQLIIDLRNIPQSDDGHRFINLFCSDVNLKSILVRMMEHGDIITKYIDEASEEAP